MRSFSQLLHPRFITGTDVMGHLLIKDFDSDLQWRAKQVAHARKMTLKTLVEKAVANWIHEEAILEKHEEPSLPEPPKPAEESLSHRLSKAADRAGEPPHLFVRKVIEHDSGKCDVKDCEFCSLLGVR